MIGLFFGTFNPIHIGHLALANYMLEYTEMQEIWFVVSPQNPLKNRSTLLSDYQRLEMVHLAIGDFVKFKVSDVEFSLSKPSFTTHTLAYLKEKYPNKEFSLIMGQDNIETIHKWKNYEYLLDNYKIFVYPRVIEELENIQETKHENIVFTKAPVLQISSSFIRKAIKEGKDVRFFLPSKVFEYIDQMNFYK
jgi:nicotinate-nucleotide adenylyltransferase